MAISSGRSMTSGIDALLPLETTQTDHFYALSKTVQENIKQNVKMLLCQRRHCPLKRSQ